MSRLNRKREADREKSKKICLERSAAKTLLTLHRQTGKSHEEHAAARALLDLTLGPVSNFVEPDDEATHEFEERTDDFPQPMATDHVNRNTQTDEIPLRECGTQVSEALLITLYLIFLAVCTAYF